MSEVSSGRERWSSRVAFISVAVGAAIGYGNVWRFPSLAFEYGGGAFFIPYIMALFIVGIPILVLEISLGQVYQQGDFSAFGELNKRLRGIGATSIQNGYFIDVYYCGLIAWTLHAFFASFRDLNGSWENVKGTEAYAYFLNEIIGLGTIGDDMMPTRLVPENVGTLALTWLFVFLCVGFGVKMEGRITYVTMGLPTILLFVFLGRSVTLPGAHDGIMAYIGKWDVSVLTERPEVWSRAVSQIFFSIGVTFGIMTAFGSHCERNAPAFENSVIIALCNSFYSFIAGFAVFAGLGYLSIQENTPIEDLKVGGPALVFGSYPVVLATLPGGKHWVRLFFVTLFLLGIDSAFALIEGVLTVLKDSRLLGHYKKMYISAAVCFISFVFGLLYVTDAGLFFLDAVDFYINFIMILVGFFETFAAGWVYGHEKQIESLGSFPVYLYMYGTMAIWTVASCIWFNLDNNGAAAGWSFVAVAYVAMATMLFVSLSKTKSANPDWSWTGLMYELCFRNAYDMCDDLSQVVGFLPKAWAILIKHVIPPILLILFINLASAKNSAGKPLFGNYESYPDWPYQVLGIFIVALTLFLFSLAIVLPDAFLFLVPSKTDEQLQKELEMKEKNLTMDIPQADDEANINIPLPEEQAEKPLDS